MRRFTSGGRCRNETSKAHEACFNFLDGNYYPLSSFSIFYNGCNDVEVWKRGLYDPSLLDTEKNCSFQLYHNMDTVSLCQVFSQQFYYCRGHNNSDHAFMYSCCVCSLTISFLREETSPLYVSGSTDVLAYYRGYYPF